jgi:hypothetical protein
MVYLVKEAASALSALRLIGDKQAYLTASLGKLNKNDERFQMIIEVLNPATLNFDPDNLPSEMDLYQQITVKRRSSQQ